SCDAAVGEGAPALRKLGGCWRDVGLFCQETRENELTRWLSSEWLRDREQLVELVGVARHHDDRLPVCRSGSRWARWAQFGIVPEDRLLELLKIETRLDPEFIDEQTSTFPIQVERFRLPTRPVQREHELRTRPFA